MSERPRAVAFPRCDFVVGTLVTATLARLAAGGRVMLAYNTFIKKLLTYKPGIRV